MSYPQEVYLTRKSLDVKLLIVKLLFMIYNLLLSIPWGIIGYLDTGSILRGLLFFIFVIVSLKIVEINDVDREEWRLARAK